MGKGLQQGDHRQHGAIQIQGVVADHAEQEQHQHQRADGAGREFHRVHGVHAHRRGQHGDGTEHEGQD
ncbi:hypothetical protein D9M69_472720 [compost metagenome]